MYFQFSIDSLILALFLGLLVFAAIKDVTTYRIPNNVTLAIALLYPAHVLASPASIDWLGGFIVGSGMLVIGSALFSGRIIGGGDVKLMTAVTLWAGLGGIVDFVFVTALSGGALAVLMMSPLRHGLALAFERAGNEQARDAVLEKQLPYGVAIAAGGLAVGVKALSFLQF